jgi:TP901 family phage tail tape measure protein
MAGNRINVSLFLDTGPFERAVASFEKDMNRLSSRAQAVGSTFTKAFTLPFAAIAGGAVKVAADFEQAMSEVKAVSDNLSQDSFKKLTEAAQDLGRRTSKSATEAAQGLKFLALAGFSVEDQLAAIEPVLRLSEAGGIDLARASDLATDAMSALGIEAQGLEGFLDVVANTSTKANSSIEQLNEAFIAVGGQFKNLGTPITEANALLGILANRGIKGSEAGNGLSTVLINLTTGAGQAGVAMKALNISAFDADGNFRGVSTVLKDLNAKFSTMTVEQQTAYKAMIGGKNRITELNALLDGMANEFDTLNGSIQDSDGKLRQIAQTMQDNLKGQITRLKSALEGLGIEVGNILLPVVTKLGDALQSLVDYFAGLSTEAKKNILIIGGVVAAIGPLLLAISAGAKLFGAMAGAVGLLASPVGIAIVGLTALAALVGSVIAKYKELNPTINTFTNYTSAATKGVIAERTEFNLLLDALKNTNLSTNTRAKLVEELNGKYKQYLPQLITEKSSLDDIRKAQAAANIEFEKKIRLTALQGVVEKQQGRLVELAQKEYEIQLQLTKAQEDAARSSSQFKTNYLAGGQAAEAFASSTVNAFDRVDTLKRKLENVKNEFGEIVKANQKAQDALTGLVGGLAITEPKTPGGGAAPGDSAAPGGAFSGKAAAASIAPVSNALQGLRDLAASARVEVRGIRTELQDMGTATPIVNAQKEALLSYGKGLDLINEKAGVFGGSTLQTMQEQLSLTGQALNNAIEQFGAGSVAVALLSEQYFGLKEQVDALNEAQQRTAEIQSVVASAFEQGANAIAQSGLTLQNVFRAVGRAALQAAAQVVKAKIIEGIASVIADSLKKFGLLGLAVGAAAGAAVGALFQGAINKIA